MDHFLIIEEESCIFKLEFYRIILRINNMPLKHDYKVINAIKLIGHKGLVPIFF